MFAVALALAQGPAGDLPAKYRSSPPQVATVVARVNGVDITAGEVESLLWEWRGFDAMQDLITYQVVKSEAQKQAVDVSDKDVQAAVDASLAEMAKRVAPGKTLETTLLEQGFTPSRLYLRFRTELLLGKMVERSFKPENLVRVSTIIVKPVSAQASDLTAAIGKAQAAYDRLKKGDKWEDVFASTLIDQRLVKSNGLLGWRDLGAFPTSVQAELKTLKPGGVTKPAQTENGIQIFRMEVRGNEAKPDEFNEMRTTYMTANRAPLLAKLRKESKVERFYPKIPGLDTQNSGN